MTEEKSKKNWLGIILAIIIPAGFLIAIYVWLKKYAEQAIDNIIFDYNIALIDYINLGLLIKDPDGTVLTIPVSISITNNNNFDLSWSDLKIKIKNQGVLIAQNSQGGLYQESNAEKQILNANSPLNFDYYMDVIKNPQSVSLLGFIVGNKITLDSEISLKIFGWIPITINKTFEYQRK